MGKRFVTLLAAALGVLAVASLAGALPPSNTAPPQIDITNPIVGQTLNGSDGTWDVDPAETDRTREWLRGATVVGAGNSYVVQAADAGATLVYRVTVTNDDGSESASSAPTAAVRQAPANTSAPTINNTTPIVGQVLTASPGTWTGTPLPEFAYEWFRSGTAAAVGAGQQYTVVAADAGQTLFVRVTGTNSAGSSAANSATTQAVRQAPANTSVPTIDDTTPAVGQVLTASPGTWTGTPALTFTYQWFRSGTAAAVGAAPQYTVVAADAGQTLFVRVTGTNTAGAASADSAATAQVTGPPVNTGGANLPSVPGNPTVGTAVTATNGTWGGFPTSFTFTYQWQRCDAGGNNCVDIAGATGQAYTPVEADAVAAGFTLRVVVTASNGVAPNGTATSNPSQIIRGLPKNAGQPGTALPSIAEAVGDGVWAAGEQLTANPGSWIGYPLPTSANPQGATFAYQWLRCTRSSLNTISTSCAAIPGATGQAYVLTQGDVGLGIRVVVVATNLVGSSPPFGDPLAVTSLLGQARIVNGPPVANGQNGTAPPPGLSGTPARGQQLIANSGTWAGYPVPSVTHQWLRCTDPAGTDCVAIGGPVAVGASSAVTSQLLTTAASAFTPADAELGAYLVVRVTATNTRGASTVSSPVTPQIVGSPVILTANGQPDPDAFPKIIGLAAQTLTLGASAGSWSAFPGGDALVTTIAWTRCSGDTVDSCTAISGATGETYTLQASDVGKKIRARVTASNGVLPDGVAYSAPTVTVTGPPSGGGGSGVDLVLTARSGSSGGTTTYTLTGLNLGNKPATGVVISATVKAAQVVSARVDGGGPCAIASTITCNLGELAPGGSGRAIITVQTGQSGTIELTASIAGAEPDTNPSNNALNIAAFVVATSTTAPGAVGKVAGSGSVTGAAGGNAAAKKVPPKLTAKRVKKTWVLDTRFSLLSGGAKLQLIVTEDRSLTPLPFLKGSQLGTARATKSVKSLELNAKKAGTFPLKVVLPLKGFSLTKSYVARIIATSTAGASSTLDLGFRGVKVVKQNAPLELVGSTLVATSKVAVPKDKAKVALTAWVTKGKSTQRLQFLAGSQLGKTIAKAARSQLAFRAGKGSHPVKIILPVQGFSAGLWYLINVDSRPASAAWTTYEIRFKASRALVNEAARAVAGAEQTGPKKSAKK